MFGNQKIKNLEEKIEELEKKLNECNSSLNTQIKLSNFLLDHKKEDVVVKIKVKYLAIFLCEYKLEAEYFYENEIQKVSIDIGTTQYALDKIENINDKISIIKILNIYGKHKSFTLNKETKEIFEMTDLEEHFANIGKKIEEKVEVSADSGRKQKKKAPKSEEKVQENDTNSSDTKEEIKPKKYDKNKIKFKDARYSTLMQYYTKYDLNLGVKGFKPIKRMGEKEAATLLYLFDRYKYVKEIVKHINLSRNSIITYAYELRKNGFLIYENEMGRVANGCLIYNVEV